MSAEVSFAGIRARPSARETGVWLYVAEEPGPERTADGKPSLSLIDMGTAAMLQVGARLDPPAEDLERLRTELLKRHPTAPGSGVRLRPLVTSVRDVSLLVGDGAGSWDALAHSAGSGFPPFSAVFSVRLDEDGRAAAAAALDGRTGYLAVRYDVALATGETSELTTDAGRWFAGSDGRSHVLVTGTSPVQTTTDENSSEEIPC